jgi:hypothetical protein
MRTEAISPVQLIVDRILQFGHWISGSYPSMAFFGEYEYPREEDYQD